MNPDQLSHAARQAVQAGDWRRARAIAKEILKRDKRSAEGLFLTGLADKATNEFDRAAKSLNRALHADDARYDAAIELAELCVRTGRNAEALALLDRYAASLDRSPRYLEMAATSYSRLDLHEPAWPLYERACALQPEVERFQAGMAACGVYLGKFDEARVIYRNLLQRRPDHQQFHYQLSQIGKASDRAHVEQMQSVLESKQLPPERNIFLYYALGKELEDLEDWDEAFACYEKAGNAVKTVSPYEVDTDLRLIDAVIETCSEPWIRSGPPAGAPVEPEGSSEPRTESKTPIFIVGLPRTGTTLTERIIGSHSRVSSVGETFFLQQAVRQVSGIRTTDSISPAIVDAAAGRDMGGIASAYMDAVRYKLGAQPMFIEKLPENYLYLGFIAKAFADARIVHLRRNPMDACFAMYKQSYFRFAYTLEDVGRYYVAYDRLMAHWRSVLGPRLIEVTYEDLVSEQERETRSLLDRLGLGFEEACLQFEQNTAPTRTASAAQVREKAHTRSVNRWKHFERQLQPLRLHLEAHGIEIT